MADALTIRSGRTADAAAIARVHVASWRIGYRGLLADELLARLSVAERESMWHQRLANQDAQPHGRRMDVAVDHGSIVGFIAAGPNREEDGVAGSGEIYAVYVHPESWSLGVGQALMRSAVDHLLAAGAAEAVVWALASNARARRFYELGGWRWDGRTRTKRLTDVPDFDSEVEEVCYRLRLPSSQSSIHGFELSEGRRLRLLEQSDATELHAVIDSNRDHLARWMPWAAGQTFTDTSAFLRRTRDQLASNDGFQAAVVEHDLLVGVIGFHAVSWKDRSTSIGYWLAESAQGRGTMTSAVRTLVDHAFGAWQLHRVEIRAGVENTRSRAIPERLGFTQEGVLREAERVDDAYVDQAVCAILDREWSAPGPS
jgi:ribosomal-protein-serine acetyltransferase